MLTPTSKCTASLSDYIASGWTEKQLIEHGYATDVPERIIAKETTVSMSLERLAVIGNEAICGNEIIQALKRGGVPVTGRLMLQGVEYGTLTYSTDGTNAVYHWKP